MIDVASLSATAQSALLVGTVLAEAVVLYVGYGLLSRAAAPHVRTVVEGEP